MSILYPHFVVHSVGLILITEWSCCSR